MSKRKTEDNRDVFEKALDYAPVAGGALLGGALGRLSVRVPKKSARARVRPGQMTDRERAWDRAATGVAAGGTAGLPIAVEAKKRRK